MSGKAAERQSSKAAGVAEAIAVLLTHAHLQHAGTTLSL
jgi:hypothetical protein